MPVFHAPRRQVAPTPPTITPWPKPLPKIGEKVTLTTDNYNKVNDNIGQLAALDRNLTMEYENNLAAKKLAVEKRMKEKKKKEKHPETWLEHWLAFKELFTTRTWLLLLGIDFIWFFSNCLFYP